MIRLIATDMDGTLLDENSQVPPETFDLVKRLREHGVVFAASSGRRYKTLRRFFEPVADQMDFVASMGTQVYADGVLLDREVFSTTALQRLYQVSSMFDCLHMAVYDEAHTYLLDDQSAYVRELDKDLPDAERVYDLPSPDVSIIKVGICCEKPEQIMDMAFVLERELSDCFTFLPSGSQWIDITPRHVSKATGLEHILRYYGIDRQDVIAFGDSMNDYAMLRTAHSRSWPRSWQSLRVSARDGSQASQAF